MTDVLALKYCPAGKTRHIGEAYLFNLHHLYFNHHLLAQKLFSSWKILPYLQPLVLKMLPSAYGLGQYFQDLGHSFSPYRPPSRQITYIYVYLIRLLATSFSHEAGKTKRMEKRSAPSRLVEQVFSQFKITNCPNNRSISQDIFTLFAHYLYSTLSSWIINIYILRARTLEGSSYLG